MSDHSFGDEPGVRRKLGVRKDGGREPGGLEQVAEGPAQGLGADHGGRPVGRRGERRLEVGSQRADPGRLDDEAGLAVDLPQVGQQRGLECRIEGDHGERAFRGELGDDRPADGHPGRRHEVVQHARLQAPRRHRIDDAGQVAHRHLLGQQAAEHPLQRGDRQQVGADLLGEQRFLVAQPLDHGLDVLAGEEIGGVAPDDLGKVGDDGGRPVDDRRPGGRCLGTRRIGDPERLQPEDRLHRLGSPQCPQRRAGVGRQGEHLVPGCDTPPDLDAVQEDPVGLRGHRQVVAGTDHRHDEAQLEGDLAPEGLDPG